MHKGMLRSGVLGAAMSAVIASASLGEVIYDPSTGGFVGKGDIQAVLGWNNAQLQANAGLLQFRYSDDVIVEAGACVNPMSGAVHPNDVWQRSSGLDAAIVVDSRVKKQITGFLVGAAGSAGDPVYTDTCGGVRVPAPGQVIASVPGLGLAVSIDGDNWFSLESDEEP